MTHRRNTSGGTSVDLIPQEHGGALQRGNPGNRGPPTSQLRQRFRDSLESRLYIAEEIADDEGASGTDRLRALEFLARYGMGTQTSVTPDADSIFAFMGELGDGVSRFVVDENVLEQIKGAWVGIYTTRFRS